MLCDVEKWTEEKTDGVRFFSFKNEIKSDKRENTITYVSYRNLAQ